MAEIVQKIVMLMMKMMIVLMMKVMISVVLDCCSSRLAQVVKW